MHSFYSPAEWCLLVTNLYVAPWLGLGMRRRFCPCRVMSLSPGVVIALFIIQTVQQQYVEFHGDFSARCFGCGAQLARGQPPRSFMRCASAVPNFAFILREILMLGLTLRVCGLRHCPSEECRPNMQTNRQIDREAVVQATASLVPSRPRRRTVCYLVYR